jgi:hypothetical protein
MADIAMDAAELSGKNRWRKAASTGDGQPASLHGTAGDGTLDADEVQGTDLPTSQRSIGGDHAADLSSSRHFDARSAGSGSAVSPGAFIVASEEGIEIRAFEDIIDVVGAAYDAEGLILTVDDVDPAFFDLHTGWAGELFQKVTNYGLRLAFILPDPAAHGPRWRDLAFEHANHNVIRFFPDHTTAEAWLRG